MALYKLWNTKYILGSTGEYICKHENTDDSNGNLYLENTHTSAVLCTYP